MNIVLASASPRRRELLMMLGMPNLTIIPAVGEEVITEGMKPDAAVCALSRQKAEEVSKLCKLDDLIIAADTIVFTGGEILGKPLDEKDAARMLKRLSNRSHLVYTGVTIMRGDTIITQCERTKVHFRRLTESEISAYIKTGEPMDKAGAYGVQGLGSIFVDRLSGDYFNVMGLPLCRLSKMLKKMGVSII